MPDKVKWKSVDQSTGYTTNSMLAVAIRDGNGLTYGALELLNPKTSFREWHLFFHLSVLLHRM